MLRTLLRILNYVRMRCIFNEFDYCKKYTMFNEIYYLLFLQYDPTKVYKYICTYLYSILKIYS